MKWWAQSFLGGIPRIVVGLRSDDGIVTDITSYNTQTLHRGVSFIKAQHKVVFKPAI